MNKTITRLEWDYTNNVEFNKYIKIFLEMSKQMSKDMSVYDYDTPTYDTPEKFKNDIKNWYIPNKAKIFFFFEETSPIGYTILTPSKYKSIRAIWISEIFINVQYRHKGYGTILMSDILAYIKEQNYQRVFLRVFEKNTPARALYDKFKFTTFDRVLELGIENLNSTQSIAYLDIGNESLTTISTEALSSFQLVNNLKNVNHLNVVDDLGIKESESVIFASGACVLYGMPITNADLDINISNSCFNRIKNKLLAGEKDGIHNDAYTTQNGELDIFTEANNEIMTYKEMCDFSIKVGRYRFLNVQGLYTFYSRLYNLRHKEKHLSRLQWLEKNYPNEIINNPNQLLDHMKDFKYGMFKKYGIWYIQQPDMLEQTKIGVCHDQSLYIYDRLTKLGINCRLVYITDSNVTKTHSFVIIKQGSTEIWMESAWSKYRGIHTLKNGYMDVVKLWANSENININDIAVNDNVDTAILLNYKRNLTWKEYQDVVTKPFIGNESLNTLYKQSLAQYNYLSKLDFDSIATESFNSSIVRFLTGILNVLTKIVNNIHASILGLFKELKRTELQYYIDANKFSINRILSVRYDLIANLSVPIPLGMITPYRVTTEKINICINNLDMMNRMIGTLDSIDNLVNALLTGSNVTIENNTLNMGELTAIENAFKNESKCFSVVKRNSETEFSKVFPSDHCLKDTFTLLDQATKEEYNVTKVYAILETIYQKFEQIITLVSSEGATLTKNDLLLLSAQTTTLAKIFDIYGVTMQDLQRVEHNFIFVMKQIKEHSGI